MKESFDPSLNFLYRSASTLDPIFFPNVIAVVGATEKEGSVGRTLMHNLLRTPFGGEVIPINPKRDQVLNVKAYPDLKSVGKKIDLIVVVTPAKIVPSIIREAAFLGIPAAVIISAGFKEMGEVGGRLETEVLLTARQGKMRIIGPNCLGVMNPITGLNATFAAGMALSGSVAFISQSGALCTAVLDWSLKEKVGFSAFVSIGSMVDVSFGDLINYFGSDPNTKSILLYMESIGDARSFLSAAREVALTKPIILIKAGRSEESAKAAASHTGSLAGSDEALTAALRRVGILRVDTISELFGMAEIFGKQPRPKGEHLAIVTNAGGPGVIATDALIASGGKLAPLSQETFAHLNTLLPPHWSHSNPVDVLGDATAEIYEAVLTQVIEDKRVEGVLVILTPQDMTDPTKTALAIAKFSKTEKPILASWMGAKSVERGDEILTQAGIPTFSYPDEACKAFSLMARYNYNLKGIYEVPSQGEEISSKKRKEIQALIDGARKEGRVLLDEVESKEVLKAYKIPATETIAAKSSKEAAHIAKEMGFPVVVKLYSKTITHKTDVGGVQLNLHSEEEVKRAFDEIYTSVKKLKGESHFQGVTVQPMIKKSGYELILGSTIDREFGPVLLFGSGGELVEVYKDRSLALPPLTSTLARRMMEQTKIYQALHGVRGKKAVNLEKLESILFQFSQLILEQPWIQEFDINPLLASEKELIALDARIILHPLDRQEKDLPKPAIRPYPNEYVQTLSIEGNREITIRPIRPEDEPLLVQFHHDLSLETVRQRYLKAVHYEERVAHSRLHRICFNDYDREIALLALLEREVLGVVRLSKMPGTSDGSFAIIVKDAWQNKRIGSHLFEAILKVAKEEKIERIYAEMLQENFQMQKLARRFGFHIKPKGDLVLAEKNL